MILLIDAVDFLDHVQYIDTGKPGRTPMIALSDLLTANEYIEILEEAKQHEDNKGSSGCDTES